MRASRAAAPSERGQPDWPCTWPVSAPRQILVQGGRLAEADEDPHDGDVHPDGARAAQDARKHGHPFLSEDAREIHLIFCPRFKVPIWNLEPVLAWASSSVS